MYALHNNTSYIASNLSLFFKNLEENILIKYIGIDTPKKIM